jgi:dinuclear metal center YbgI/SA1388 family protein
VPDAQLADVVAWCDRLLEPAHFKDYDRALNGLQVENSGRVSSIAAAVDATLPVLEAAAAAGADLVFVHHGLFWGGSAPWTGRRRLIIQRLVDSNIAVYSQHLPLDGHPTLGNAAVLAHALGLANLKPFFLERGSGAPLGVRSKLPKPWPRQKLADALAAALGRPPTVLPGGGETIREIGICTGGAGAEMAQAKSEGVDAFITGEGPHWTYALAEDLGLNVFYGGHYATEIFGVRELAKAVAAKFRLPWTFIDRPTGL